VVCIAALQMFIGKVFVKITSQSNKLFSGRAGRGPSFSKIRQPL
jgi:hypothetical protein